MTKCAALELAAFKVRVNSIHPGHHRHADGAGVPRTFGVMDAVVRADPHGRAWRQPEDVARLALFLASDDSTYCTGSEFIVDGGMTTGL